MKNSSGKILVLVVWLLPLAGLLLHYFYIRPALSEAYEGHPDALMSFVIKTLYPRFEVEKNRFALSFFLAKASQVLYRAMLVYYLLLILRTLIVKYSSVRTRIIDFFYANTSSQNIDIVRTIFFTYLLYLITELCHDLIVLQPVKAFYKPLLWLRLFHIPFPGFYTILIVGTAWYLSTLLVLFKIRPVLFTSISLAIFLIVQCWVFSFEKMDHGYVTFTYVFIMMPFLLEEQYKNKLPFSSWSLQLIRISIVMVYFLSAMEKLFISKLSWLQPESLKAYLSLHETPLSLIIVQHNWLCFLISVSTLLLQFSFPCILFFPKYKWIWIGGGILFHTGTLLVMGIGHPLNPWLLVYVFFFDWTGVADSLSLRFKKLNRSSS